jgi:hypothetical protein
MTFSPSFTPRVTASPPPSDPYKKRRPPPELTTPSTTLSPISPSLSSSPTKLTFCRRITAVTRPPHRLPHSSELRNGVAVFPSPSSTLASELLSPRAVEGHAPVSAPPCPSVPISALRRSMGPSASAVVHGPWTESMGFSLHKIFLILDFPGNLVDRSWTFG